MPENQTQPTGASVHQFLAKLEPADKRRDAERLREMMERISGEPAKMWGPSIVGFGRYQYRYASGREGVAPRIGFSPRKANLTLYILWGLDRPDLLARLGKYVTSVSCLYLKRLSDIDEAVLEELITASWIKGPPSEILG